MVRLSSPIEEIQPHYEIVVIGSGYGGGITASRMARAGRSVCILERGKELQPGEYPDTPLKADVEFQATTPDAHFGSRTGMLDLHAFDDMSVFVGCGLGGTSLVNANVALRAEPRVFDDPRWPQAFRNDANALLEESYARAEAMLKPNPYPEGKPGYPPLHKTNGLRDSAKAMNKSDKFYLPPINVTFEDKTAGNHVGVSQAACNNCGDCVSGCNVSAKNTTLMNYIPDAFNHGADVFTQCSVRYVEKGDDGKWIVHFQPLHTGREKFDAPTMFVKADIVVVSAGTLGSTEILLRSKQNGLPVSDQLGKRFSGNGDVLAFAYNSEQEIDTVGFGAHNPSTMTPVGPCITGIIDLRNQPHLEDGMVIEEGSIPGAVGPLVPLTFKTFADLVGAPDPADLKEKIKEKEREVESLICGPYTGAIKNTQTFLVMSQDDGKGEIVLENDRAVTKWPGVGTEPNYIAANQNLQAASYGIGATFLKNPIWSKLIGNKLISVHPLGGCCMGEDAANGVVNHKGQVFTGNGADAYEGLYVSDGAVIPRPLGVNPLLTISATAERAVHIMAADRGWTIDYTLPVAWKRPSKVYPVGIEFTETMKGYFLKGATDYQRGATEGKQTNSPMQFTLTIVGEDLDKLINSPDHPAHMAGTVTAPLLDEQPLVVTNGTFGLFVDFPNEVETKHMTYKMLLTAENGRQYWFDAYKIVQDSMLLKVWHDTTTLYVTVYDGPNASAPVLGKGILRIEPEDFMKQMTTMRVLNAPNAKARAEALLKFGEYFAGVLYRDYGGVLAPIDFVNPDSAPRVKRQLRAGTPGVHYFETSDHVQLRLTHYKGGDKGPVILSHGLGVSSLIFAIDTIETNMLEYLYANGYDCWLLDYRASIELPSAKTQFTGDDIATKDYPAAVQTVLKLTGAPSVQMVVHCFGSLTFFMAMAAGLQGVRSAVASQVALNVETTLAQKIRCGLHMPSWLKHLGVNDLTAIATTDEKWYEKVYDQALKLNAFVQATKRCNSAVCHRITFMYAPLYEHTTLNDPTHVALEEMFGIGNITSFEHLALTVREEKAVAANGDDVYMPHADRIKIPIKFIHGEKNECYLPESTEKTLKLLQKTNAGIDYSRNVIPDYGHIDCIFGKNAAKDVFPFVLEHLEKTAKV
ncbi:MAG TPA: alpha/beta fold hydrolase [Thermoanaerobaculia bacterium]|nr:alpha/beta fold hydrolase [Thermoanaerobaculia bacterium]